MVDGTVGFGSWWIWAILVVATAAFWVVTFLAVRALLAGRDTIGPPNPEDSRASDEDRDPDPLQERLERGEITVAEYERLRVKIGTVDGRERSRARHH